MEFHNVESLLDGKWSVCITGWVFNVHYLYAANENERNRRVGIDPCLYYMSLNF